MRHEEDPLLAYESSGPLTAADGDTRIQAPTAYAVVRQTQMVRIVHIEAFALASWFPICWRDDEARPVLVVLRTLFPDGSHQPHGSPETPASQPLALRAYPFVVGAKTRDANGGTILIDDVVADRQTDVGAPISTPDGRPGRGTQARLRAAAAFNDALDLTERMTAELYAGGLLEPWRLEYEANGEKKSTEGLLVVRPADFDSPRLFRFIRKFGALGASLLGAHRISLFRAGALVQLARAGTAKAAATGDQR